VTEAYPTLVPAPVRQPRQVGAWHQGADGRWSHRPRCKVLINAVLRALQPWPRKLVIYTDCDGGDGDQPPRVLGYGLGFVQHLPAPAPDTDCDGDGP
jgi:hypothetical protein